MGLDDAVPADERDYIEHALTLARDPEARSRLVERIRAADNAIFEDEATAEGLAGAFERMAREARARERP